MDPVTFLRLFFPLLIFILLRSLSIIFNSFYRLLLFSQEVCLGTGIVHDVCQRYTRDHEQPDGNVRRRHQALLTLPDDFNSSNSLQELRPDKAPGMVNEDANEFPSR